MNIRQVVISMAMAILVTAFALAIPLMMMNDLHGSSSAIAQTSQVTCYPNGCFGGNAYSGQCAESKRSWEQNKRNCEAMFNLAGQEASRENCIHAMDLVTNQACTCADACRRARCTEWNAQSGTCLKAEFQ
jgi:hypothetical protein